MESLILVQDPNDPSKTHVFGHPRHLPEAQQDILRLISDNTWNRALQAPEVTESVCYLGSIGGLPRHVRGSALRSTGPLDGRFWRILRGMEDMRDEL